MAIETTIVGLHLVGVHELRRRWGWFLALGILLLALGAAAVWASVFTTMLTMVLVGWLMIAGGVLQAIHAFGCRAWSGFFIDLLAGILYAVVGAMILTNPAATAMALTLLIAVLLILGGIFRIVVALMVRYHHWLWLLAHGVVNVLLGVLIWQQWPLSGLWVIGLFIGIDMIFNGWTLVMLGLAARSLTESRQAA